VDTFLLAEVVLMKKLKKMKKMTLRNLKHAQEKASKELSTGTDRGKNIAAVIAKDATLLQDRSGDRRSFQGRFRTTAFGDFKHKPGRADEHSEALQDDYVFEEAKAEASAAATATVEAAAADGVIVEEPNDQN
jgi:hypothetical protein